MSRSSSANVSDMHGARPASGMGQHPTPSITPQPTVVSPQPPGTPGPSSPAYAPPNKKRGSAIVIKNPNTGAIVPTPTVPAPATSAPVVVSSPSPAPGRAPSRETAHSRSTSRSGKTSEEKRQEMKESIAKRIEETKRAEEEERKRKEEEIREKERAEKEAEERQKEAELRQKEVELRQKEAEEAERIRKEEEEREKKEAEEREKAEIEEIARKMAEAKAKEEEVNKKEEIRLAKEKAEEEARLVNEKVVREAAEKVEAEKDVNNAKSDEDSHTYALSKGSATPDSESMPPPPVKGVEKLRPKPSPLNLPLKTNNEPGPPSAALTALRSARPLLDLKEIHYPEGVSSPNPALNPMANGRFKYDKDFLMQFQNVFTEKPSVDWDQKMRDTVGDTDPSRPGTARTPSGMGPRSTSSRSGAAPPLMGYPGAAFGNFKTPLTSAERFQKSTPGSTSLANMFPGQSRPGPAGLVRTASSTSLASARDAVPPSPRTGNRSQRGSKRGGGAPMEKTDSRGPQPTLTIPISEVKPITMSENRWKPMRIGKSIEEPPKPSEDTRLPPEMVQRKVKAALNKMTPEKFDRISDQILEITGQSKYETDGRTLRQVIQLTFEKATDEAHWASMYAKFCKRMLETMDPNIKDENIRDKNGNVVIGGNLFRKYLLNRCQEEFERGWKLNLPPKPEGETEEAVMLSDEYYIAAAAKRRGLGLVQFIGELFKLGMLTERIMNECVRKLLDFEGVPEDETVESLVKLIRTIGKPLDMSEKSRGMMDAYFQRIATMSQDKELNSRMRFMLMVCHFGENLCLF